MNIKDDIQHDIEHNHADCRCSQCLQTIINRQAEQIKVKDVEIEKLRKALREFGQHERWCPAIRLDNLPDRRVCECRLGDALKGRD